METVNQALFSGTHLYEILLYHFLEDLLVALQLLCPRNSPAQYLSHFSFQFTTKIF